MAARGGRRVEIGVYAYEHGDYAEAIEPHGVGPASAEDVVRAQIPGSSLLQDEPPEGTPLFNPDLRLDAFASATVLFFDEVWVIGTSSRRRGRRLLKEMIIAGASAGRGTSTSPPSARQKNGDRVRWVLPGTGAALLALNVASYWAAWSHAGADGYYATEAARSDASSWRTVQFTSLGLFGGAWAYGIADGFIHYRPEVVVMPQSR